MPDNRQRKNVKSEKSKPSSKNKKSSFKAYFKKVKRLFLEMFKGDDKEKGKENKTNLEIVKGSRKKKLIIRIVVYSIILVLIVTVLIINALTPTGLIEKIQNNYTASGKGEFPVNIYAQNPDDFISNGDVSFVLNGTYLELYNKNGKLVNAISHGMFNPVLEISEARMLLFDRDRYSVKVYNYSTELIERSFEKNVCSASIGRDGSFAVVTTSDTHNNTVSVYNKENEEVFTWNSAEYYVFDVAVSNKGDSIAVCLVNAKNGSFVSTVYILEYDSATPVWKHEFNTLVTTITSVNEKYFLLSGVDSAFSIEWEGGYSELDTNGVIRCYSTDFLGFSMVACGREDNEQSNSIFIIGEDGDVISDFEFTAPITDVCVNNEKCLILSSDTVYVFDLDGMKLDTFKTDTKPLFAAFTKDGEVLVVDNSQLKKPLPSQ